MTELARVFFLYQQGKLEFRWAEDAVHRILEYSVDNALGIILELVEAAPTLERLGYVGSGELDFALNRYGKAALNHLKLAALKSDRLLYAMSMAGCCSESAIKSELKVYLDEQLKIRDLAKSWTLPESEED